MNHLSEDELVDAVDGTLSVTRRAHADTCSACRERVAGLEAVFADVHGVELPEPSPLFWDHLSSRVRRSIADESVSDASVAGWAPRWLRWPVLAPMTGLAVLVLVLASAVGRAPDAPTAIAQASAETTERSDVAPADETWAVVSDLVGAIDVETAQEAGIATALGSAEHVALQLSALEQQELVRLLQQEIDRVGS